MSGSKGTGDSSREWAEVTLQVEGVSHYKRARGTTLVSEITLSQFPNLQAVLAADLAETQILWKKEHRVATHREERSELPVAAPGLRERARLEVLNTT